MNGDPVTVKPVISAPAGLFENCVDKRILLRLGRREGCAETLLKLSGDLIKGVFS